MSTDKNDDGDDLSAAIGEELRFQAWLGLIADRDPILDAMADQARRDQR